MHYTEDAASEDDLIVTDMVRFLVVLDFLTKWISFQYEYL